MILNLGQKNVGHFYILDNFGKSGSIFIFFFAVKFRNIEEEAWFKIYTSLKSIAALLYLVKS